MPGVYGRKVSLLLLMSSLESLLGPAMAVTSAHEEGAAVSQVGRGRAVTEAAVSKSGNGEMFNLMSGRLNRTLAQISNFEISISS